MRYYHYTIEGERHDGPKSACPVCQCDYGSDTLDPEKDDYYK